MKKFLIMKDHQSIDGAYLNAGEMHSFENLKINRWSASRLVELGVAKEVETRERYGVEWIQHDGGGCPVPDDWKVKILMGNSAFHNPYGAKAKFVLWVEIDAYCIRSTGEDKPEEPNYDPWKKLTNIEMTQCDRREPSPQEAAYAAKVAAMQKPKPEPKKLPARCLDDVEFKNLLGLNQFVRGEL